MLRKRPEPANPRPRRQPLPGELAIRVEESIRSQGPDDACRTVLERTRFSGRRVGIDLGRGRARSPPRSARYAVDNASAGPS